MEWMLDIQLGRRNLSPIQRIAVTEKYRPIYEKQAKENLEKGGRKGGLTTQNKPLSNLTNPLNSVNTNKKLADIAGVKPTTYKMGAKVLSSDNEELKERVLSGEKKRLEGNSKGGSSNNEVSLQLECNLKEDDPVRKDSWTDSQTAKKAGVGVGTVARYNRVMNSDDEAKQRKVAVEYVKLCGYKNGEIGNGRKKDSHNGKATQLTLDQIAEQLGTSKTNLTRALTIERNLTESMKQLLDDGVISKTVQQRK